MSTTYKFSTLQELLDRVPTARIRDRMSELAQLFVDELLAALAAERAALNERDALANAMLEIRAFPFLTKPEIDKIIDSALDFARETLNGMPNEPGEQRCQAVASNGEGQVSTTTPTAQPEPAGQSGPAGAGGKIIACPHCCETIKL